MGPVNLRAKTEEKIISQSIDELEMEKLDLTQAIEKLRLAINKINNEGKNRLLKAYEDVNKNFSELFKKLFNGELSIGQHSFRWNGLNEHNTLVGSGIYFCKIIKNNNILSSQKMVLLK